MTPEQDAAPDAAPNAAQDETSYQEPQDAPNQPGESGVPEQQSTRPFEDLTLAEVLGQFWRAPRYTLNALNTLELPETGMMQSAPPVPSPAGAASGESRRLLPSNARLVGVGSALLHVVLIPLTFLLVLQSLGAGQVFSILLFLSAGAALVVSTLAIAKTVLLGVQGSLTERLRADLPEAARHGLKLALWVEAFILALWGSVVLVQGDIRTETTQLYAGTPYLLAGLLTWGYADLFISWRDVRRWLAERRSRDMQAAEPASRDPAWNWSAQAFLAIHPVRIFAALGTGLLSVIAYVQAVDNQFRTMGFIAWVLSVVAVVVLFAPHSWSPGNVWQGLSDWNARRIARRRANAGHFRISPTMVAFLFILLLGVVFRVNDLTTMPPQMTSDHKELILDAYRVQLGDHAVFFSNNGGREGAQMYAMALFAGLPGLGLNHDTLIALAVIESILTLPAFFWLGRQVAGRERPVFGNALGLVLMGLLAVSYWHLAVTRLALRIVLTPLVAALLLGFMARALRYNRRGDFLAVGLLLGFGLYTYQAVRMLPLVVVAGVVIAALYYIRDGRRFWRYFVHLLVVVIVSFVIFVPLFRYSVDYPEAFWRRSIGRIFGDQRDEAGRLVQQDMTLSERLDALQGNLPQLADNVRGVLLMFHWQGDQAWINGVSMRPELDPMSGALLLVGLVAGAFLIVRTRDPVYLLIPIAAFIMLLPSALSLAMVNENPSATRASGAMPAIYLLAAFPLTLVLLTLPRVLRRPYAGWLGAGGAALVILFSMVINWNTYYNDYREVYRFSTWPYSIPGDMLQGFAMSDGTYANAFMVGYPNWWDYEIIGIEAGAIDWPNGIVTRDNIPLWLVESRYCPPAGYQLNPERDLLFFYHYEDDETEAMLQDWFPDGYVRRIETYNSPNYDFKIFRVPALGMAGFESFAQEYGQDAECPPPEF